MKKRIAFFDTKPYDKKFFIEANREFQFEYTWFETHLDSRSVALAGGHDGVCIFVNDSVNREVIDRLAELGIGVVGLRCAGYNNVDFNAAFGKVHIVHVPAYSPHAVAEHAVALILTLNRKIHKAYARTRDGNFSLHGLLGFDLFGKTAGIIGTGQIGKSLAVILGGFGMHVLINDLKPDMTFAKTRHLTYVPLDEIYREADIISLHCPLTRETEYMINESTLKMMKQGVMIINTGRGKLIDTRALIAALKKGRIGSAGLDVYEEETDFFFEDRSSEMISDDTLMRLLTFPNVVVTSHQGFFTAEALRNIAETTMANFRDFFDGKPMRNEICYKCLKSCPKQPDGRCF
jgi:D-lactate dehydrogenase